ncbi:AfsR/SARP family transcriptional regulator [Microbispora bryophytorum]|uniref:Winged helix-turn-helix domain-containing protein n=1 Tax=Microbispora bryophytorum subsp. camponoti TaxID=1677852 RepID=A0ABR8L5X1_9ACTN|nr:AfsR/SARP family transcriptional regulator [Microbispora camponoti]MBD3145347.1 winged helix-turn-helix domain-containing protein [Microbispora camponoti]
MGDVSSPRLHCSILGSLEVRVAGRRAVIGAPKQRLLLAILLCHANAVIPSDQLIDSLWGETPPRTARKNLQVYMSALRKIVGDRISFQGWGYRISADREELDLLRFLELGRSGRAAVRSGDLATAAALLGDAVRMWRERPLEEFCHVRLVAAEVGRFTELFLSIYEDWVELEIELGRHVEALGSLDVVAARFPARERVAAARMTALSRCGRAAEALAHFEGLRRHLAAEMGIDPSPVIRQLYQAILRGDGPPPARLPGLAGAARPRPVRALANRLPRAVDFVGREAEVRRILDEPSPVTVITGALGAGKTALAVHVAHLLAPRYPDGAVVIPLRRHGVPRPAADVQREILEGVGLEIAGVREDDVLASVWRSWLADRKVLLVLDDSPDESSVRMLLPGTTSSRVLVTSRSRLSGLESVARIDLDDLSTSECVEFLGRLIGCERVAADLPAVLRILRRCGPSPLVLRLLGARLAGLRHLPLDALAERLERTEDVLDEFVAGDVSLRMRFEESYAHPSWPHRAAFLALGTLDGPVFGHEELVAALDGTEGPGERVIESLLEAGVLSISQAETGAEVVAHSLSYAMSPLAHRFAAELGKDRNR